MNNFSSIFELLAAFNFALVSSDYFLESVNIKITGHLSAAIHKINSLEKTLIKEIDDYLGNAIDTARTEENNEKLNNLSDFQTNFETIIKPTVESAKVELDDLVQKEKTSTNFRSYCLFSGIYCLLILFFSGMDELNFGLSQNAKVFYNEFWISFNIIILLLIYISKNQYVSWITSFSLEGVFYLYIFGAGLASMVTIIPHLAIDDLCNYNLYFVNILISIFVPALHFLFVLIKAFKSKKKQTKIFLDKVDNLETKLRDFKSRCYGANGDISNLLANS